VEWAERMRPAWDDGDRTKPVLTHRKLWEWVFCAKALHERGMLAPGMRGLGFGVGQEPLAAFFASFGCEIVASDVGEEVAARDGWAVTGQHAKSLEQLNEAGLCPPDEFAQRVSFRSVDMNDIPTDLRGFDFTWSSCAFEHLGSIVKGQEFILNQMACLKPGGVGVHTTEYNVSSNRDTIEWGQTVAFRRRDIEWLVDRLHADSHLIEVDYDPGDLPADRHIDVPPYSNTHLKVQFDKYAVTSLALVIERNPFAPADEPKRDLTRQARVTLDAAEEKLRGKTRALVGKAKAAARSRL
jgi:2-polyprenyl-3-methyl-5-hydroxy-6-metoxy-1,4-benzoquinol methylase